jgi:hypothetical protein
MARNSEFFFAAVFLIASAGAQAQTAPNVSQVLVYSATNPTTGAAAAIFTQTTADASHTVQSDYTVTNDFAQMTRALNANIATALSIIPLSSPASGVIQRTDPTTGAEWAESSTLGPIFTERAETIGKGHFYIGFSNQDFHFTQYNGTSLNALSILDEGGAKSAVGNQISTPATIGLGMDVRLSQDIAFLTYGVTDRFDVSVGLPVVHSAVAARTYNGVIYTGNGAGTNGSNCWCVNTFTAANPDPLQSQFGQASLGKTGFGDLLIRAKGTIIRTPHAVVAAGADLRAPTGNAQNYLGVGAASLKPFVAVSFYSKPLRSGIVLSPHFDVGWQFTGNSVLGGALIPAISGAYDGRPFTTSKGTMPDVFSWAGGVELAVGHRSTFVADILGNQVGWIHGIPSTITASLSNQLLPTGPTPDKTAVPTQGNAEGLVATGRDVSFGQYNGSFGYKLRVAGNLIVNVNALVRFDNNGLTARLVPLFGIGYSF